MTGANQSICIITYPGWELYLRHGKRDKVRLKWVIISPEKKSEGQGYILLFFRQLVCSVRKQGYCKKIKNNNKKKSKNTYFTLIIECDFCSRKYTFQDNDSNNVNWELRTYIAELRVNLAEYLSCPCLLTVVTNYNFSKADTTK